MEKISIHTARLVLSDRLKIMPMSVIATNINRDQNKQADKRAS